MSWLMPPRHTVIVSEKCPNLGRSAWWNPERNIENSREWKLGEIVKKDHRIVAELNLFSEKILTRTARLPEIAGIANDYE